MCVSVFLCFGLLKSLIEEFRDAVFYEATKKFIIHDEISQEVNILMKGEPVRRNSVALVE